MDAGKDENKYTHLFDNDEKIVEESNQFTIQQWRQLTKGWDPANVLWATKAASTVKEEREELAAELKKLVLEGKFEKDSELAVLQVGILSLSDSALERLNQALLLNEIEDAAASSGPKNT